MSQSGRLGEVLRGKRSMLIVMQDNPDPDSLAAAAGLRRIANSLGGVSCSIGYGGVIGRGENRALAEYLGLNFRRWEEIDPGRFDAIAMVDTQPQTGNNSLSPRHVPDIVIDHHPLRPETKAACFFDIRPNYGAVSSILVEYLRDAGIEPETSLATALLYAIRSDTQDLGLEASGADEKAAVRLFPRANLRMLSSIQRGRVQRGYFHALAVALDRARVHDRRILAALEEIDSPDLTGEMADILLRHEGILWVLCYGIHDRKLRLSLRTAQSKHKADEVMRRIVSGIGTGGGHGMSAGGQVPLDKRRSRRRLVRRIDEKFLRLTGGRTRGRRLVPRLVKR